MEKELTLNNGTTYILREIQLKDANAMIPYLASIAAESDNLTFGPGEFTPSVEDEEKFIDSHIKTENSYAIVAIQNNKIIGNLSFEGGGRSRLSHAGEFGVSVLKDFWGNGIATELIKSLLDWAISAPITKINLKVKDENSSAITLYKKLGFEIEGKIKRDFCIAGIYYDSIIMGKIID